MKPAELRDIRRRVASDPAVGRTGDSLTIFIGSHDLLLNIGGCLLPGTTAGQMHEVIHRIEADLKNAYPETSRVYFEVESLSDMANDTPPPGR